MLFLLVLTIATLGAGAWLGAAAQARNDQETREALWWQTHMDHVENWRPAPLPESSASVKEIVR